MDVISGLTLAAPAGLNAYVPLLMVALAQRFGLIHLKAPYDVLGSTWLIALVVVLLLVEVVADKIPAVDHVNDGVQTVVRPAVGGLLALAAAGHVDVPPVLLVVAGILIAGSVHAVKASARPAVNVSTAGMGAPVVSTVEDLVAVVMTILAFVAPVLAAALIVAAVIAVLVMVRRWRRREWTGFGKRGAER
jgi:hypothetical protein